jgi:phytol kinase
MSTLLAANPWLGMLAEALALAALMVGLRALQRRVALSAEATRKLFHVGGGLTTLAFPWLFHSAWPVLALMPVTIGAFLALKYLRWLRRGLGNVLYGIERRSLGEVYMPLSLTLVWVVSGGDALLYCVPVLVLTLADPAAALIGARYGRRRYASVAGEKSLEGSLAFGVVALCSVLVPLLAFAHSAAPHLVLVALDLSLLVMLVEAVAWRGLDNLFIPVVTFALMRVLLPLPTVGLLFQLALTVTLAVVAFGWRHRVTRRAGATRGGALGTYLRVLLAGR